MCLKYACLARVAVDRKRLASEKEIVAKEPKMRENNRQKRRMEHGKQQKLELDKYKLMRDASIRKR